MSGSFGASYAANGRPGVLPQALLKAMLFQCLHSVRSDRELCMRISTGMLFRWFLDMEPGAGRAGHGDACGGVQSDADGEAAGGAMQSPR